MSKGKKHIAAVFALIVVFAALILSGCMPGATGTGGAAGGAQGNAAVQFLPLILIVAVFYFLLIRPQNKKNKQINEMRNALKRGDYVTTIGGFRGRVTRVNDDVITIEVGANKVKLEIMRWGISKIEQSAPDRKTSNDDDELDEVVEEEQPKRKPRKLSSAAKKEQEPEAEDLSDETEDLSDEDVDPAEDDETKKDK